jgi:hypothetical protein
MYLIRYGIMGHVGRFSCTPDCGTRYERGETVVIESHRGLELGEVLFVGRQEDAGDGREGSQPTALHEDEHQERSTRAERARVLRPASALDLEQSRQLESSRASRFAECQRVLDEGDWPWELIDVEPLLDGRSTVLHYLGPHQLDATPWRARFRVECDFDVMLEPVGADVEEPGLTDSVGGGCGNCDCGGGGCGSNGSAAPHDHGDGAASAPGCGASAHAGCSSCGISQLLAARDRRAAGVPKHETETSSV